MRTQKHEIYSLSAVLFTISLSVQAAPVTHDAGLASSELRQQPELVSPLSPELMLPERATPLKFEATDQVRIVVTVIHVAGSSVFPVSELEALVSDLVGQERDLAELEAGAARLTAYYRAHGYPVARAYLPAQEIKAGAVTIEILEGRVGEQRIINHSLLSDDRANGYLSEIKSGEVLGSKSANRALLLLNDTPGVESVNASLQPGASVGTSDLIVELTPSAPYTANVEADNYGNHYTGEVRLGVGLLLNSPQHWGDKLSLQALTTDRHLSYLKAGYQFPVGDYGARMGTTYSVTRYRLGEEFSALQAYGSAYNASVYGMYPFVRSPSANLSGIATWERKALVDGNDLTATRSDKWIQLVSLGMAGNHQGGLGRGGGSSYDLTLTLGILGMDALSRALDEDPASANSNGKYTRIEGKFNHRQKLMERNALTMAVSCQLANKNLNSSEKFLLGGAQTVRAYPQGEASGDEGYLANMELRHDYAQNMQGLLFYDAGSVKINRHPYISGTSNTRFIAGAGVGMEASVEGFQFRADLAWRTSGGDSTSAASNRSPRLWLHGKTLF